MGVRGREGGREKGRKERREERRGRSKKGKSGYIYIHQ